MNGTRVFPIVVWKKNNFMEVITQIMCGLGNQMFQYACGRSVAHRLDAEFYLDLSWFDTIYAYDQKRTYMLDAFPGIYCAFAASPKINKYKRLKHHLLFKKILRRLGIIEARYIQEPGYNYWSGIENIRSSVYLTGFWQNEQYFTGISDVIRHDFSFPAFSNIEAKRLADRIHDSACSVSIHIRRGDYIEKTSVNQYHGMPSLEYYKNALQILANKLGKSLELFLFTDDPDWVKQNFDALGYFSIIVDIPQHRIEPYNDMHLMSLCKHHIIANSSFSWWGAWLSAGDGIVIAPKQWFTEETMKYYSPVPSTWIGI